MADPVPEKNFGPHIVGMMMGVCVGSYIEYGVTREEFVDLAGGMYDGITKTLAEKGVGRGFGELSDEALDREVERLKRMVTGGHVPKERGAALWYLLGKVEDLVQRVKDEM